MNPATTQAVTSAALSPLLEAAQARQRAQAEVLGPLRTAMGEFEDLVDRGAVEEAVAILRAAVGRARLPEEAGHLEDPAATLARATGGILADAERVAAGKLVGVPTGLRGLDEASGGWPVGLSFIGGWSSAGKSSLLCETLIEAREAGSRWCLYSADMPVGQWLRRLHRFRHKDLRPLERIPRAELEEILAGVVQWLVAGGCAILERARTVDAVVADGEARRGAFDLLALDTLHSLAPSVQYRSVYEQLVDTTLKLKGLATGLGVPLVATAQVKDPPSRHETSRADDRERPAPLAPPVMNELEGGRRLTQEAAQVVLVHRTDYGHEDPRSLLVNGSIILAKSQNCRTARVPADWDTRMGRWIER